VRTLLPPSLVPQSPPLLPLDVLLLFCLSDGAALASDAWRRLARLILACSSAILAALAVAARLAASPLAAGTAAFASVSGQASSALMPEPMAATAGALRMGLRFFCQPGHRGGDRREASSSGWDAKACSSLGLISPKLLHAFASHVMMCVVTAAWQAVSSSASSCKETQAASNNRDEWGLDMHCNSPLSSRPISAQVSCV